MPAPLRPRPAPQLTDTALRRLETVRARVPAVPPGWVPEPVRDADGTRSDQDGADQDRADQEAADQKGAVARHRPERAPLRLQLTPPAVVALALLGALAVLVAVAFAWRARPSGWEAVPAVRERGAGAVSAAQADDAGASGAPGAAVASRVPPTPGAEGGAGTGGWPEEPHAAGTSPAAAGTAPSEGASGALLLVHVAGEVLRPGVVTVPPGSRVADTVAAAGGPTDAADLTGLNLARPVADGEQVLVLRPGQTPPPPPPQPPPASAPAAAGGASARIPAGPLDLNAAGPADLDALPGVGPVLAQRIVEWRTANGGFRSVEELREVAGIGPARYAELSLLVRV